jgi:hypothetical protein
MESGLGNLPLQSVVGSTTGKNTIHADSKFITIYGKDTPVYAQAEERDSIGTLAIGASAFTAAVYGDWYVIEWPEHGTAYVKQSWVSTTK